MTVQMLDDTQVQQRLQWDDVLNAIETGFHNIASFEAPERNVISKADGTYLTMPCVDAQGWYGVKTIVVKPDNPQKHNLPSVQAWYTLADPSGVTVLACNATLLTRFRTAATSAVAAKYLAPKDARTLLVIGTGSLAPWMAEAHAQVRNYQEVLFWGRDAERLRATVQEVQRRLPTRKISPITELAKGLDCADVISAATTSRQAIITADALKGRQHVDLVGAFLADMRECDSGVIGSSQVYIDSLASAQAEAGDLIQACKDGWSFDRVAGELQDVVKGEFSPAERTLFKSVGHALEDLVVARLLVGS